MRFVTFPPCVATLRAPFASQRPIRKTGFHCSGERFFSRKGSSRSQTARILPHAEFSKNFLHHNIVNMVYPTIYDGNTEVTHLSNSIFIQNLLYATVLLLLDIFRCLDNNFHTDVAGFFLSFFSLSFFCPNLWSMSFY